MITDATEDDHLTCIQYYDEITIVTQTLQVLIQASFLSLLTIAGKSIIILVIDS